jgi:N-acetylglucosamine-6-phosphate deacetylase
VAGVALSRDDVVVQLIADGVHVAPEALLTAWRAARDRIVLVSDAISAAGLGDGHYSIGGIEVTVERGVSRTRDGTLAGAVRPLGWGLRLLVELGVPVVEAVATVTTTPARLLGRADVGVLRPGAPADLVVLDDDFAVERVYRAGALVT